MYLLNQSPNVWKRHDSNNGGISFQEFSGLNLTWFNYLQISSDDLCNLFQGFFSAKQKIKL